MGRKSKIEWLKDGDAFGATWNPLAAFDKETGKRGWFCVHASAGCKNPAAHASCYAELINLRLGTGHKYIAQNLEKVEIRVMEGDGDAAIDAPLRWKKPTQIFVCSMTDLFADFVNDGMRDRVFATMALARWHTFDVLTKRARAMREYMTHPEREARWMNAVAALVERFGPKQAMKLPRPSVELFAQTEEWIPLPNVRVGVSAEDQKTADERIPELLRTPAAVRWVSAEPLLGPIDLRRVNCCENHIYDSLSGDAARVMGHGTFWNVTAPARVDWVVAGGESGPGARAMHPDWPRSLRDQCVAAGVAFHFKQWGEWMPDPDNGNEWGRASGRERTIVRHEGIAAPMTRVGKKDAGRTLDGRTWDEQPETNHAVNLR